MSDLSELERLRRLEALDELLPTLAGVLDIRDVFARVSDIARRVLPHDGLGLPLLTEDRQHVTPYALAGPLADGPIPERVAVPSILRELVTTAWEYRIIDDIQAQPALAGTPPYHRGFRGALAVPIRLQGELVGLLSFLSFTPGFFVPADVLIARRIADHVALALSHQRLAEAAARAAEARERAYAPYSGFKMGAAVVTSTNAVVPGALVENVSLGLAMCAERAAMFGVVSGGAGTPEILGLVAPRTSGELTWPCGACLQVGLELGGPDLLLVVSDGSGAVAQARLRELASRLPFKGSR